MPKDAWNCSLSGRKHLECCQMLWTLLEHYSYRNSWPSRWSGKKWTVSEHPQYYPEIKRRSWSRHKRMEFSRSTVYRTHASIADKWAKRPHIYRMFEWYFWLTAVLFQWLLIRLISFDVGVIGIYWSIGNCPFSAIWKPTYPLNL